MKIFGKVVVLYMMILFTMFIIIGLITNNSQLIAEIMRWPLVGFVLLLFVYVSILVMEKEQ